MNFEKRKRGSEGIRQNIFGQKVSGRGKSKYKGPQWGTHLAYSKNISSLKYWTYFEGRWDIYWEAGLGRIRIGEEGRDQEVGHA